MVRVITACFAGLFAAATAADAPVRIPETALIFSRDPALNTHLRNGVNGGTELQAPGTSEPKSDGPRRDLVTVYATLGRDAAAIRTAKHVLAADPTDVETARSLARLFHEAKRFGEAADVLSAIGNVPMAVSIQCLVLRDLARARQRTGDGAAAEKAWLVYGEFLDANTTPLQKLGREPNELTRERAAAWEHLGHVRKVRKQWAPAADAFQTAAKLSRSFNDDIAAARLHWHLSGVYQANGEPGKAIVALELYLANRPNALAPCERYAALLAATGTPTTAVAKLQALNDTDPSNERFQWVLAAERCKLDFAAGDAAFQRLIPSTTDEDFFRLLVTTYAELRRAGELLAIADRLFPLPTENERRKDRDISPADARRGRAFATALAAQASFAVPLAAAAKGTGPHSSQVWELIGWLADRAGQPDAAIVALRSALTAAGDREFVRTFLQLRLILSRQRQWQAIFDLCDSPAARLHLSEGYRHYFKAGPLAELGRIAACERSLEQAQADARFDGLREKAHVYGLLGRYDDMLKLTDEMLNEFTTVEEVRSVRYLRSDAYLGLKDILKAEAELRSILADDPDDVLALNNLGYNLADQNRKLEEAERLIRRAMELDCDDRTRAGEITADHAAYLDSLGWVLFRRGDLAGAREMLAKASTLPDGRPDPTVWDHLGDVCFRLGDKPAAKVAWTNAVERYRSDHRGRHQGRQAEAKRKLGLVE